MIRKDRWKLVNNSGFGREQLPKEPEFGRYDVLVIIEETVTRRSP